MEPATRADATSKQQREPRPVDELASTFGALLEARKFGAPLAWQHLSRDGDASAGLNVRASLRSTLEFCERNFEHRATSVEQVTQFEQPPHSVARRSENFAALLSGCELDACFSRADFELRFDCEPKCGPKCGPKSEAELDEQVDARCESLLRATRDLRASRQATQLARQLIGQHLRLAQLLAAKRSDASLAWNSNFLFAFADQQVDFAELATLRLASKRRPSRVCLNAGAQHSEQHSKLLRECYASDESEKPTLFVSSRRVPNVCELLDDNDNADDASKQGAPQETTREPNKWRAFSLLDVEYSSSLASFPVDLRFFCFESFGYLFRLNFRFSSRVSERRLADFKRSLLSRLALRLAQPASVACGALAGRAMFTRRPKSVRLQRAKCSIQFPTSFRGQLPIRVCWSAKADRKQQIFTTSNLLTSAKDGDAHETSVAQRELRAQCNFDAFASAQFDLKARDSRCKVNYRFWRSNNDALLELDDFHAFAAQYLDESHRRVEFECRVSNVFSSDTCKFEVALATSSTRADRKVLLRPNVDRSIDAKLNLQNAILRTWSQRTIKRSQPTECKQNAKSSTQASLDENSNSRKQATIYDKFGSAFAYNPTNLQKRLDEQKLDSFVGRAFDRRTVAR